MIRDCPSCDGDGKILFGEGSMWEIDMHCYRCNGDGRLEYPIELHDDDEAK